MGRTSRRGTLPKGAAQEDRQPGKTRPGLLAHGDPTNLSEHGETAAAASPPPPARLEGQALPLGARRRRRLARPGLHLPPPPQAEAQPLPRPRQETGAAPGRRRGGARRAPSPLPPGAYQGPFGLEQAVRLLNRAGFGPVPGQAEHLVSLGLVGAVQSLTRPSGAATLTGPPPVDDDGAPIAPADAWGHDHLWWLDRMVRTDQPLVERMALVFHDWFATSIDGVSKQQQMIDQSNLFRSACFGSFLDLFKAVTVDPAMLQWLNGAENRKGAPNENYGREMMELFSLGADRGAYTEDDIREAGPRADRLAQRLVQRAGRLQLPLRPQTPRRTGQDGLRRRPATGTGKTPAGSASRTPSTPPSSSTSSGATSSRSRRRQATREGADQHLPRLRLADPPGAGDDPAQPRPLRRRRRWSSRRWSSWPGCCGRSAATSTPSAWIWLCEPAGQVLFRPPNVSGWDDTRWLDTSRMRARWNIVDYALDEISVDAWNGSLQHRPRRADEALARAVASWGSPALRRRAPGRAARLRPADGETDRRQLAARPLPGDAPERPAAADRRQPRTLILQ